MPDTTKLTFTVCHEAWYWDAAMRGMTDRPQYEIMLHRSCYDEQGNDDGVMWEFRLRWDDLGPFVAPRLEMWDDSWMALTEIPEFFLFLADKTKDYAAAVGHRIPDSVGFQEVAHWLTEQGWTDITARDEKIRADLARAVR